MKSPRYLLGFLIALLTIIFSCSKGPGRVVPDRSSNSNPIVPLPDREYFWAQSWQKTATGYEIKLSTYRLTDSAISKGIKVHVAMDTEMVPFEQIPVTTYLYNWPDSINLSYTAVREKLTVVAKTSLNITWKSDVFIRY